MPRTKIQEPPTPLEELTLFPYQIETVELMQRVEEEGTAVDSETGFYQKKSYAVLSNPVGSGKTAVVLKLIKENKRVLSRVDQVTFYSSGDNLTSTGDPRPSYVDVRNGDPLRTTGKNQLIVFPITLVICPKPLVRHWKTEAERMRVPCITFDAPKQLLETNFHKTLDDFRSNIAEDHGSAVIVSMHLLQKFLTILTAFHGQMTMYNKRIFLTRIVCDDIHSGTTWTCGHSVSASFLWFVNSTFSCIPQKRFCDIHFLTELYPQYTRYGEIVRVVSVDVPTSVYEPPPLIERTLYYRDRTIVRHLENHLTPEAREMMESGDFTGVYNVMAGFAPQTLIPISERIPIHELISRKYKDELDHHERRKTSLEFLGHNTENVIKKIQEIKRSMEALSQRIREVASEHLECPICMCEIELESRAIVKCCNNVFCKICIGTTIMRNGKCPLCRETISLDTMYAIDEEGRAIDLDYKRTMETRNLNPGEINLYSTPMEVLKDLILETPEGKFVVFVPNEYMGRVYKTFFKEYGIKVGDIMGSSLTVSKTLESFSSGIVRAIFMSSRTSNAGLNLQMATDVVIIGSNPGEDIETQSIGRVRRFPRTEPVPVHYIKRI